MTITIEVNGQKIECQDEKSARKAMAKAVKEDKAAQAKRNADYQQAHLKAQAAAYRVLAQKLGGETFPRAWRFYKPSDQWAVHLFQSVNLDDGCKFDRHKLNTQAAYGVDYNHYGYDLIGAVCDGAGFCWLVVLQDRSEPHTQTVLAIGVENGVLANVECPGIQVSDFAQASDHE